MRSKISKHKPSKKAKTTPIKTKEEVQENPDNHIDQDFPGFPHSPSKEEHINPKTKQDKKVAGNEKTNV
ncbi:MAG: hypothetical protein QM802_17890 [Agriterribacter sp.]